MFDYVHKIDESMPEFRSGYQAGVLDHWHQILHGKRYPAKKDFRPQNFPQYLPQIAIISVDDTGICSDRLTGETITEILHLGPGREKLVGSTDKNISLVVRSMLDQTSLNEKPTYFTGEFKPEAYFSVGFSALVLPFCYDEHGENMDALLLAFDFEGHITNTCIN